MGNQKFVPNRYIKDTISKLVQEETGKRQYYRPIYSLHKWWARRPGTLFRSIILLATRPASADSLFIPSWDGTPSERSEYFQHHDLSDVIILDPFMGGGTTLAEANRLGAKVVGCDINPISFWVVRETLKPIDLGKLDFYFHRLEQTAGKKIKGLYRTACVYCKTARGEGLYAFWVRFVKCLNCGNEIYLFKRTLLNEGLSRNKPISRSNPAIVFCPRCFVLNEWFGDSDCQCKRCGHTFDPYAGTYDKGYYNCPHCNKEGISLIQTMKAGQRLRERWIAIEYWCPRCKERLYKSPDADDIAKIEMIKQTFEESKHELVFPKQPILEGASSVRWRLHNYKYYYEVFNARQLLAFNYLIDAIRAIPEEEYRNAFITVFSNMLEYNNMMTPYNYPNRKLHHLFNYHAMPLTTTPVENSVWGVSNEGAGTFVNCYRRYIHAKQYCQRPFDRFKDSQSKVRTIYTKGERIAANFVSSFKELKQVQRGAFLLCQDSSNLSTLPDESVDFIITDPPYFDNIHYSELSNFFYVWLKLLLNDHRYFSMDSVPTEREAIVNAGMNKGEEGYCELLTAVFKECERVLKNEGLLIFTFHHTKWRAWWTILVAVAEGGFRVTDSFPVTSEYKVNPHVRNKQALDMDLVLVCRKRHMVSEPYSLSLNDAMQRAMDDLAIEANNSNKNELFLYFMGELLKAASAVWDTQKVTYEWFSEALKHFDELVTAKVESTDKGSGDTSIIQLQLL